MHVVHVGHRGQFSRIRRGRVRNNGSFSRNSEKRSRGRADVFARFHIVCTRRADERRNSRHSLRG